MSSTISSGQDSTATLRRLLEMLPADWPGQLSATPLVVVPFGTIEWHSYHLPVGLDSIKAEALGEVVASLSGGVLAPTTHWAVGGVPFPHTARFDLDLVERLAEDIFRQMALLGFKVIVALTGHYGLEQLLTLKRAAVTVMRQMPITIWAGGEFELVTDLGYTGDHAGRWETSLLWAVRPDLVRLDSMPAAVPLDGVIGADPRQLASRESGEKMLAQIAERLCAVAVRLLHSTSEIDRIQFLEATNAIVRVLERLLAERISKPRSQVPPTVTPGYVEYAQAMQSGNYKAAQQSAEARLIDLYH